MVRKTLVGVKYVDLTGNTMEIINRDGNLYAKVVAFGPGEPSKRIRDTVKKVGDSFNIGSTVADQAGAIRDFEFEELLGTVTEVE